MRVAILAAVLGLGATSAGADTLKPSVVWQNRVVEDAAPPPNGGIALTTVSHTLYLNDCMPNGCTVTPGTDSSLTNRSSIPDTTVVLDKYPHGTEHWNSLVQCVKDTFAPFDIEIVTTDPGASVPHHEVMIGGSDTELNPQLSAGGVAPFISCNAQRNNGLSFVFPAQTSNLNYLCAAVVQEATHVWGLDHELNAKDPMTYLDLGSLKRFQNNDAKCGEELNSPRNCRCTQNNQRVTQNSFRYMINTFGLKPGIADPMLEITTPKDGAWVKPGFPIGAVLTSPLDAVSADIKIDGTSAGNLMMAPFVINAPTTVPGGDHMVSVTGNDAGDRSATATVNVHVMASCAGGADCKGGTHCLQDLCWPGSNVDGGLGADCVANTDCISGSCGSDGSDSKCVAACDEGNKCPSGYECIGADAGQGVCWQSSSGGCSTNGSPGWLVFGLGVFVLGWRKRR